MKKVIGLIHGGDTKYQILVPDIEVYDFIKQGQFSYLDILALRHHLGRV
jgi:hypothetical protein